MEIDRRENETSLDYHKRIIYGKLVDKTLSDYDYSELAELIYGKEYASDVARRMMYGSRKTLDLLEQDIERSIDDVDIISEIESKRIELQKERQKFYDQRNAYTKAIRDRSRQEEINEILVRAVENNDLPRLEYEKNETSIMSDNDLLVSLNDIHYGADIHNYWNEYDSDICRDMMREYLDKIIDIAKLHNSENCYIWCNGDAIHGNIHYSIAVTNKENVLEQIMGVSELISEFVAELSKHFKKVVFSSVAGNHSRITPNKDNEVKGERLDNLIEWYLAARLHDFDNVFINSRKIDDTMYEISVRGKTYVGVHGDQDPGETKIQALQTMVGKPVYAVLSGHKHHNEVNEVQGVKTIMAGSFMGMDDFCIQKRIYGKPEQMVCVCDDSGVRCMYDIFFSGQRN